MAHPVTRCFRSPSRVITTDIRESSTATFILLRRFSWKIILIGLVASIQIWGANKVLQNIEFVPKSFRLQQVSNLGNWRRPILSRCPLITSNGTTYSAILNLQTHRLLSLRLYDWWNQNVQTLGTRRDFWKIDFRQCLIVTIHWSSSWLEIFIP